MDRHKASWILEFVLRQPIDDWLAKEILLRLPTPPLLDPHLKKTLFLRRLSSDLSSRRLSEHTLQSLELLEELDRSLGAAEPYEALRAAYCAVAAELTTAPLRRVGCPAEAESEFLEAADRIWSCRVADLERSDARGLVGEGLREWRREVEDAVAGGAARGRLLRRDTRGEVEAALGEYLRVALEDMGPPLLELVAGAVGGEAGAGGGGGAGLRAGPRVASVDLPKAVENPPLEAMVRTAEIQNRMAEAPANANHSAHNQNQADTDVYVPSVEKDAQATATERTVVEGQHGGERAEMIQRGMTEAPANPNDSGHNQIPEDVDMARPSIGKDAQATSTVGTAVMDQQGGERVKRPCISLMERNPTARTCQWDEDSNESLSEKSADSSKRPHLPTPRVRRVSPLKLYKDTKFVRRRKNKRWTPQEEDALREAVQKHGVGNWKFILQCYHGTFEDRTEVDLKDKWRNMTRSMPACLKALLGHSAQI